MTSKTISTTITHGVSLTTASYNFSPLYVTAAGAINTAVGDGVNGDATQAWTVANTGLINTTASAGYGVRLLGGGRVVNGATNATTAKITASTGGGVYIKGSGGQTGSVTNFG